LAECYGAGTGCGWCRPFLKRLFDAQLGRESFATGGSSTSSESPVANDSRPLPPANLAAGNLPSAADYARGRSDYVRAGGGTPPPGATPID
jgi:hypothetical protein